MPYSDSDSDDEFGAMIYQSSLTAKRHQKQSEVVAAEQQVEDTNKAHSSNDIDSQTKDDNNPSIQTNNIIYNPSIRGLKTNQQDEMEVADDTNEKEHELLTTTTTSTEQDTMGGIMATDSSIKGRQQLTNDISYVHSSSASEEKVVGVAVTTEQDDIRESSQEEKEDVMVGTTTTSKVWIDSMHESWDQCASLISESEISNNDVLCGRGGIINAHPGNEQYRMFVDRKKRVYLTAKFTFKRVIAQSIVDEVKNLKPPGRFLLKDPTTNIWSDVGDEKARDKTSQALREDALTVRKQIEKEVAATEQDESQEEKEEEVVAGMSDTSKGACLLSVSPVKTNNINKKKWPPPPVHILKTADSAMEKVEVVVPPPVHISDEHRRGSLQPLPKTKEETEGLGSLNKQGSNVSEVSCSKGGGTVSRLSVSPVKIMNTNKRKRPRLPPPVYMPPIHYGVPPPTLGHTNKVTCNLEGCNNTAQQGGRCMKHGGKYIPKHYDIGKYMPPSDMVHPTGYSQYGYLPPHPGFSQHRYPPPPPPGYYYPHPPPPPRLTHTIVHNGHNDKSISTNKDDNDDGSVKEEESSSNAIHGETANQVIQAQQPPQAVNHINYQQQQQQHQPQPQQQEELNVTTRAGKKEREGFLMFLRMLMNNLKVHDEDTYTKAKSQIQVYYSTIQQAVDEYTPAKMRSLQEKLRTIVGEENWVKTRDSFRRYLQSLNAYEAARKRKAGSTTDEDPDHKRLKTELVRSESSAPAEETDKEAAKMNRLIRSKVEEKLRIKMSQGQQTRNPPSSPEMSHKIEEKLRIKMAQIQQKSTTASMPDRWTVDGALPLPTSLGNTVHQKRSRTPSKKKKQALPPEIKQAKKKLLELSSKLLPPKPFTDYTIFFRIEKAYLTQIVDGGAVDPLVLAAHDPNHHDPLEMPRPERYQDVIMAPYWYSSLHKAKIEKKRKHRKVPGRMSLSEMSKTVSANWRNAIPEVIEYCRNLSAAEQEKYHHACQEIQQRENEAENNKVVLPQYDAALIQQYAIEEMKRRGYDASSMVATALGTQDSSSKKKKKVAAVNENNVLETTIQVQASINIPLRFSIGGNVEMDTHSSPIQATTTITTQPSPEAIDIAHIMTSLRRGDSVSAKPTTLLEDTAVAMADTGHLAGIVATNVGSTSNDVGMSNSNNDWMSNDDWMPEYVSEELQNSHYF